ncbi:efflux RND transporter periplasmic adaptor subunit [Burkholderia plantarii]|uniref:efflux RND transporter periplasmic adaptor subunit n=1 Tax=Burkholderia plantarii TaxID=41899 RepID=UPI0018DE668B|nr:efflux RND transporter periplasmic adaptor subunit [Burkholderia plantarii]MBI0329686.1 efflux RND transporter periplasmic adaptor subunit [Burkholderia plantarii]
MEEKRHSAVGLRVDESSGLDLPARAQVRRRAKLALIVAGLLLAALAVRTLVADHLNHDQLEQLAQQNARQYVSVVRPSRATGDTRLALPGTLRGYVEAPIYARASGYVSRWDVDIGTRVKAGQVLAELDTPEVDQEFAQAVAQRQQVQSTLALARTSFDRARQLRQRDAVSQQELDDRQGAYNQAVANLSAADANVRRLTELKGFQKIVAPVDGVVTQRNIDIGDLVNAGNGGAGRALFVVTQADRLRLYVRVPQTYAQQVRLGQHVAVTQSELPGRTFDGTITHTAQAIDVATRTLQIEITLPNGDGRLLPGAYVKATLPMAAVGTLSIPANTLLFRAEGPTVAVVGADGRIALHPVRIARTLGKTLEIDEGVEAGDRLVLNPSDSLANGDTVIVKAAAPANGASSASSAKASTQAASATTSAAPDAASATKAGAGAGS